MVVSAKFYHVWLMRYGVFSNSGHIQWPEKKLNFFKFAWKNLKKLSKNREKFTEFYGCIRTIFWPLVIEIWFLLNSGNCQWAEKNCEIFKFAQKNLKKLSKNRKKFTEFCGGFRKILSCLVIEIWFFKILDIASDLRKKLIFFKFA